MAPPPWVMFASNPAISLSSSSSGMSGRTMNMISYVRCMATLQSSLLAARFTAIELVHGRAGPLGQHHFYCSRGAIQNLVQDLKLRLSHRREHKVFAPPPCPFPRVVARRSNPDTDAQPLLTAPRARDRLDPVVSSIAAPFPDAQRPQTQRDLVVDHDQVTRRVGIKLVDQRANRHTAQVHVGFGFGQNYISPSDPGGGCQSAAAPVFHRHTTLFCQPVDGQKPRVMRSELVFDPRVSQADHEGRPVLLFFHRIRQVQSRVTSCRPFPQPHPEFRSCPSWPL